MKGNNVMSQEYLNRVDEYSKIESTSLYPPYPLKGLHIELSNVCNHQCIFCANRKMTRKKGFIDEQLLQRLLDEAYQEGFREVGFYLNGEPFLSKNLCTYIKWAKEKGYTYIYLDSNGGAAQFEFIEEILDAGLDSIKYSINGTTRESYKFIHGKDDYEQALLNLKKTYQYKKEKRPSLKVYVSIAVTKYIEDSLDIFVDYLKKYCDEVLINDVIEMGGYMTEELRRIQPSKKLHDLSMSIPCYMLWNGLYITYEGYATACCADYQNYFVYADLNKTTIKEAWHNEIITDLRKRHIEGIVDGLPCGTCVYGKKGKWVPLMPEYASKIIRNEILISDLPEREEEYKKNE